MDPSSNDVPRKHPCFELGAKATHGRLHLPVAPRCNVQCMFCNRNEDCVNESRPGVTSRILTPAMAVDHLRQVLAVEPSISVVGIAGPGDPLANAEATFETLRRVREEAPDMLLCLSTNGLGLTPEHIERIAELGVSHVTITINAVDPEIGQQIYARVREERVLFGRAGAELILSRQLAGLAGLKARGIQVKINTVVIPGVNDHHVGEIARVVSELGADFHNCVALLPTKGTPFAALPELTQAQMTAIRAQSEPFLRQMTHCTRCRADAVGLLGKDRSLEFAPPHLQADILTWAGEGRPNVAVATGDGLQVDVHLGAARKLQIWDNGPTGFRFLEERPCPEAGVEGRWDLLGQSLQDCRAILVGAAGETPRKALEPHGLLTLAMTGSIVDCLEKVFRGNVARALLEQRQKAGKGCGCAKVVPLVGLAG